MSFAVRQYVITDTYIVAASDSIPPALLARARNIVNEHKQLTEKLANGFDMRAAKKAGEYSHVVNALKDWDKSSEVGGHVKHTGQIAC